MGSSNTKPHNNEESKVVCPGNVPTTRVEIADTIKPGSNQNRSVYDKRKEYVVAVVHGSSEEYDVIYNFVNTNYEQGGAYESALTSFFISGNQDYTTGGQITNDLDFFQGGIKEPTVAELANYENSVASSLKEDVVRRIARALNHAGLNIDDTDSLDNIILAMKRDIPNPTTNKQTFSTDAEKQKKICQAIAKVLNEQFTPGASKPTEKFINTEMSPVEICRRVAEWVHSFAVGVNTEFLAVHNSVQNAMRNVSILDAFLDITFKKINDIIDQNSNTKRETEQLVGFYNMIKAESDRQKEMLKNILKISLPSDAKELSILLGNEKDLVSFIKRINYDVGSQSFSTALTSVLGSLNLISDITNRVHKALKMLHIKVNDYLKNEKYDEFADMIEKKFQERLKSSKSVTEMDDLLMAAKLLHSNFNERANMEESLKKSEHKVEGGAPSRKYSNIMDLFNNIDGEDPNKTELEKKIERIQKMKLILIKKFINTMTGLYGKFNKSVESLGHKFGKNIPLSEYTDRLRDIIVRLGDINTSRIELDLIGYYSDAAAREKKEKYLSIIQSMVLIINEIVSKSEYKPFAKDFEELRSIINDIISTIHTYSEALKQKVDREGISGSHEDNIDTTEGSSCGCVASRRGGSNPFDYQDLNNEDLDPGYTEGVHDEEIQALEGGDDTDKFDNIEMKSIDIEHIQDVYQAISKSQYTLKKSVEDFKYFYYIARVYSSLSAAASETEAAGGAKYIELLGDTCAAEIRKLYTQRDTLLEKLKDEKVTAMVNELKRDTNPELFHIANNQLLPEIIVIPAPPAAPAPGAPPAAPAPGAPPAAPALAGPPVPAQPPFVPGAAGVPYIQNPNNVYYDNPQRPFKADKVNNVIPSITDIVPAFNTISEETIGTIVDPMNNINIFTYLAVRPVVDNFATRTKTFANILGPDLYNKFKFIVYIAEFFNKFVTYVQNLPVPNANVINIITNYSNLIIGKLLVDPVNDNLNAVNAPYMRSMKNRINIAYYYTVKYLLESFNNVITKTLVRQYMNNEGGHVFNAIVSGQFNYKLTPIEGGDPQDYKYLNAYANTDNITPKEAIDALRTLIEKDFEVKINFYKVIQAIDLYLKDFTVDISKHPDAVKDIVKILDGTHVIVDWFNDQTGNNLWKAFECMGTQSYFAQFIIPNAEGRFAADITPVVLPAAPTLEDIDNYNNYQNQLTRFNIFHNWNRAGRIPVIAQGDSDNKHYYEAIFDALNEVKNDNLNIELTDQQCVIADPYIGIPSKINGDNDRFKKSSDFLSNSIDSFQALKNLINAFVRIGESFGGNEIYKKIFMSPTQIYKYLIDYIKTSAYYINYGTSPNFVPNNERKAWIPEFYISFAKATDSNYNNFETENKYFAMIIKAMSAKILVVLGIFELFDRKQIVTTLDPIRMITGGAPEKVTIVIPEAAELYFRLPRLAEFYRKLLFWRGGDVSKKITMLPEMSGSPFSEFVRLIFQKIYSPDTGNYSDFDAKLVIQEINNIYKYYHGSQQGGKQTVITNYEILSNFVKEINRRIGIIKAEDMKKYWKLQQKIASPNADISEVPSNNYRILPLDEDTDDYNIVNRLAPSDRYLFKYYDDKSDKVIKPIDKSISRDSNIELLNSFRYSIENLFDTYKPDVLNSMDTISYTTRIEEAEKEMKENKPEVKLSIALKLIQSTKEVNIESEKVLMFHETVVSGLNALGSIYEFIKGFQEFITEVDPIKAEIKFIETLLNPGGRIGQNNSFINLMYNNPDDVNKWGFIYNGNEVLSERLAYDNNAAMNTNQALLLEDFLVFITDYINNAPVGVPLDISKIKASYSETSLSKYDTDADRYVIVFRTFARFAVNYQNIMNKLLENIFAFANDDLISVKIISDSNVPIQFNFSTLVSTVENMIDSIKSYINKFRPILPSSIIEKYEKVTMKGSIYWFEKEFIDKLFKGTGTTNNAEETGTINEISSLTNKVFNNLVRNTMVTVYGISLNPGVLLDNTRIIVNNALNAQGNASSTYYEFYGNILSEMVYYNNTNYYTTVNEFDAQFTPNTNTPAPLQSTRFPGPNSVVTAGVGMPQPGAGGNPANGTLEYAQIPVAAAVGAIPLYYAKVATGLEKLIWKGRIMGIRREEIDAQRVEDVYRLAIWDKSEITEHKSLLFAFNQLLALHLNTSVDQLTYKVYSGLLDALTNNIANNSIYNPRGGAYPDLIFGTGNNTQFGRRGDPQSDKIIVSSLAYILQRLTRDSGQSMVGGMGAGGFDYLITTLTDVPNYIKERYKYALPYTYKLFSVLNKRCEFLKDIIQKTKIDCTRSSQQLTTNEQLLELIVMNNPQNTNGSDSVDNLIPEDYKAMDPLSAPLSSEELKQKLSTLIDSISQLSVTIQSSIYSTINELSINESVKYFETSFQFIQMYQQRYNKMPLMPLSFSLYALRDLPRQVRFDGTNNTPLKKIRSVVTYNDFNMLYGGEYAPGNTYPQDVLMRSNYLPGSSYSKLQYGLRPIVSDIAVNIASYPGVKDIIDRYNNISTITDHIDMDDYSKFMNSFISIVRYNLENRNFKSYVQPTITSLLEVQAVPPAPHVFPDILPMELYNNLVNTIVRNTYYSINVRDNPSLFSYAYEPDRKENDIIYAVETTNQEEEIIKITKKIKYDKKDGGRMAECIANILDLNIIPINLNVLMKEIPLFNLYNYDYTFELLMAKLYNKKHRDFKEKGDVFKNVKDTQDALIAFLFHPYINLDDNLNTKMYLGSNVPVRDTSEFISRIMRGDNNLGLGRPKFLSDQIFNKVLLRSLYPSMYSLDEAGVTEAVGIYKGQNGYDTDPNNLRSMNNSVLTYPYVNPSTNKLTVRQCVYHPLIFELLQNVGRLRFDSTIIRNLFLITNVLRITRFKLYSELTANRNVVVSSHYAITKSLTEYGEYPFDVNETYDSKNILGESRFEI